MLKVNLEKMLVGLLIISAVLGYVVSYQKLYLFHVVAIFYYLAVFLGLIKISKKSLKSISLFFFIFAYSIISLMWAPNIINGIYYLFYLVCGLTILIAITNYAQDMNRLYFVFKVAGSMLLINFFIGLLETTGHFRLPVSPYALSGTFSNVIPGFSRPSGFNSNLNNFGFVFAITFPFLFLYPQKIISILSLFLLAWFTYNLQSKGFFLGVLVFFVAYFIVEIKRKSTLSILFLGGILSIIVGMVYLEEITSLFQGRIFTLFEQISRGIDLITSGEITPGDSTSTRALFYYTGLNLLYETYGLGLGLSGVTSILELQENKPIAFHFFFLELLVDLGVLVFIIIVISYLYIITMLFKVKKESKGSERYIFNASIYSLLILIPSSIAPSSIIYILSLWVILGFVISLLSVSQNIENQELLYRN